LQNNNIPIYEEFAPPKELEGIVVNYWTFIVPAMEKPLYHIIPPDGTVSLTFTMNKYMPSTEVAFSGAGFEMKEVEIPPMTTFIGCRFHPGAFNLVFSFPLEEIKYQFVDASYDAELAAIADTISPDFRDFKLLDRLLLSRISGSMDQRIEAALHMIIERKGDVTLQEIHQSVPLNKRHFQRLFKKLVGVTAKEFCRLIRIRQSLVDLVLESNKITDVAYDRGYFDQSHFNRDLLKLSQRSPKQLKSYYKSIEMASLNW